MLNTPILLICFNRADHVRRLLSSIREVQPTELYIAQDGPRTDRPDDPSKILAVREVIREMIDWPCNLHALYQEENLGCGPGPYAAMSWFFSQVEYGIVLEDDLEPHPLFFEYMEELLVRYKDEHRVGLVTAHNQKRIYTGKNTYYLTYNMAGTLGWGTWARVWKDFDFNIQYNQDAFDKALMEYYHLPKPYRDYENHLYARWITGSRHDVWDHQFKYYLLMNGYLDAKPNCCLVSHLGTDADATHTGYVDPGYLMDIHEELFQPMSHPIEVKVDSYEMRRAWIKAVKVVAKRILRKVDF